MTTETLPPRGVTAIVNVAAGGGRAARRAEKRLGQLGVAARQANRNLDLEVQRTERPGHAVLLARAAARAGRDVIAAGGDGTAYEVLNGLLAEAPHPAAPQPERLRLAVLPLGTGNSLAHDLTPEGADRVIAAIVEGRTRALDVLSLEAVTTHGETRQIYLLGNLSVGFPAQVAALTNRHLKPLGLFGYSVAVLVCLIRLKTIELAWGIDPRSPGPPIPGGAPRQELTFLSVSNNPTFGGNMLFAPHAQVDDGLADLAAIAPVGRFELLRTFPKIFRGKHVGHEAVRFERARAFWFETDGALDLLLDGEVECLAPRKLQVMPHAIRLFA